MSETNPDERWIQTTQIYNLPILAGFEGWLQQSALSERTIKVHMDNIRFFTSYLVYYEHSPGRLDAATSGDVYLFLADWFPRKALWASVASMKGYLGSFKKFFKWMGESGLVSLDKVDEVLSMLKESRNEFLERAAE